MTPSEIITLAHEKNLTVAELCRRAEVDYGTFMRWKKYGLPETVEAYLRIVDVIKKGGN